MTASRRQLLTRGRLDAAIVASAAVAYASFLVAFLVNIASEYGPLATITLTLAGALAATRLLRQQARISKRATARRD